MEKGKAGGTKAQRTKEKVFASSIKLMKEKGYQNTTIRDICADANVSIGTFYSCFPAKSDLFLSIYMEGDRFFSEAVALNVTGSTHEKIIEYFKYYVKLNMNTGLELMKILFQSDNPFFTSHRPMQKVFEGIIEEGLRSGALKSEMTAPEIVDFFFVIARGCCYNWCVTDGAYDLEKQLVDYVTLALAAFEK